MPVIEPNKRAWLVSQGYNPDEFEDVNNSQPESNQPVLTPSAKTSSFGVAARSFLRSATPTAIGLGVGAATSELTPFVSIPAGVGAGMLASYLQRKGADVIAPKSFVGSEQEQQDITEHPTANIVGGLVPQALALRPSMPVIKGAANVLMPGIKSAAIEKAALGNIIGGAALPAGLEYGQEAYNQNTLLPKLDSTSLGLNMVAGALLHQPTRLGAKLGLHPLDMSSSGASQLELNRAKQKELPPSTVEEQPKTPINSIEPTEAGPQELASTVGAVNNKGKSIISPQDSEYNNLRNIDLEIAKQAEEAKIQARAAKIEAAKVNIAKNLADKQRAEQEVIDAQKQTELTQHSMLGSSSNRVLDNKPADVNIPKVEESPVIETSTPEQKQAALIEANQQKKIEQLAPRLDSIERPVSTKPTIEEKITPSKFEPVITEPPKVKAGAEINKKFQEGDLEQDHRVTYIGPQSTGVEGKPGMHLYNVNEDIPNTTLKKGGTYSERTLRENGLKVPDRGIVNQESGNVIEKPTPAFSKAMAETIGAKRNVDTQFGPVFDSRGRSVNESVDEINGARKVVENIDPKRATLDTQAHGYIHPMLQYLEKYGTSSQKHFVSRAYETIGKSEPFKQWIKELPEDSGYKKLNSKKQTDEYLTQKGGEDFVRRLLEKDGKGFWKNWLSDFYSNVKHSFGKATDKDYAKLVAQKLIYERPHSEGIGPRIEKAAGLDVGSEAEKKASNQEANNSNEDIIRTKVPSEVMQFDRRNSHLDEYLKWLIDIKGDSLEKAQSKIDKIKSQTGIGNSLSKREESTTPEDLKRLNQEGSTNDEQESKLSKQKNVTIPFVESVADRVNKTMPEAAKGYKDFQDSFASNIGKLKEGPINNILKEANMDSFIKGMLKNPKEFLKQNSAEFENVVEHFNAIKDGKQPPALTPKEEKIKQLWIDAQTEVRKEIESRPGMRQIEGEAKTGGENYFPSSIKPDVMRELTQYSRGDKAKQLREDFLKVEGNTQKDLDKLLESYNKGDVDIASQFGPLDKPHGIELPESWRNNNFLDVTSRYLDRSSRRLAYHDIFQKTGLEEKIKDIKNNEDVKTLMNDIKGNRAFDHPLISNAAGIVRAGAMGTLTGAKDVVTSPFLTAQHFGNPFHWASATVRAVKELPLHLAEVMESGRTRRHMNSLEMSDSSSDLIKWMKRTRDVISDVTGRNFMDQIGRAINFGQGKMAALDFHSELLKGNLSKAGKDFIKDFGEGVDFKKKDLSKEDLLKIAGRVVDSAQGDYTYNDLPRWSMEGSYAPYFSLARWSIGKANNYMKHSVNPLLNGNPRPFLMSTLGTIVGGSAVVALTEAITGRKQKTNTWSEISNSDNSKILPTVYKSIGLAAASGHAGILSDIAKAALDLTYGKNRPQLYNNVLVNAAENIGINTANFIKAANDNGLSHELVFDYVGKMIEDNIQTSRLLLSYLSEDKKDEIEKANKYRDLRAFNLLEGNKITDLSSDFSIPFEDGDIKKFKKTTDVNEAMQLLPGLINKALEKAENNPEKLKQELAKIKENNFQSMPNPSTLPLSFIKYIQFLNKTQGNDEAQKRLTDYITHNEINKAKSSAVP